MKVQRQSEILQIIQENDIETQDQLLEALEATGLKSTQATISRDIKELHLIKELTANGTYRYVVSERKTSLNIASRLQTIFQESVTSFEAAQNIVVIKTMPGLAPAACSALDGMKLPNMVGSLAGDDTALLIMRKSDAASQLCDEIKRMLEKGGNASNKSQS